MSSAKEEYVDTEVDSLSIDEEVRKGMIAFVIGTGGDNAPEEWQTYWFRPSSNLPQVVQIKFPDGEIILGNLDRNAFVKVGKPFSLFTPSRGLLEIERVRRIVKRYRKKKGPPPIPSDALEVEDDG